MTDTEQMVYEVITRHYKKHGFAPHNTDVARDLGYSRQRIDQLVNSLDKKGYLKKLRPGLVIPT